MVLACVLPSVSWAKAPAQKSQHDPFRHRASAYLVRVGGTNRWERSADAKLAPASLTKMMTALLVLESGRPMDDVVTVTPEAARETGHRIWLKAGNQLLLEDLLAATVMHSANDACHALAAHVAGDEETFVSVMNQRALLLGLKDTHFTNACGHDNPMHYSTARDLAVLAEAVLKEPEYVVMSSRLRQNIQTLDQKRTFRLKNSNHLVGRYQGAMGVKTGYTPGAGKCVVVYARRNNANVLLVLLNSPSRWWMARSMLDRAFAEASDIQQATLKPELQAAATP